MRGVSGLRTDLSVSSRRYQRADSGDHRRPIGNAITNLLTRRGDYEISPRCILLEKPRLAVDVHRLLMIMMMQPIVRFDVSVKTKLLIYTLGFTQI